MSAQPASTASGPTPQIEGGWSELTGTVSGPAGLVEGATVRIERDTTQGLATIDVQSDELGRWRLSGILGGRYRVRGWLTDLYAMNGSQVLFLNEGESVTVDLSVGAVDYGAQLSFTHMGDIGLGLTGTVAVSVTTRRIAADSVVHVSGVAGAFVTLAPTAGVMALPAVAAADADGVARFVLRCHSVGSASAVVQYQNRRATFTLPNCVDLVTLPVDDPAGGEGESTAGEPATPIHQNAPVEVVVD